MEICTLTATHRIKASGFVISINSQVLADLIKFYSLKRKSLRQGKVM